MNKCLPWMQNAANDWTDEEKGHSWRSVIPIYGESRCVDKLQVIRREFCVDKGSRFNRLCTLISYLMWETLGRKQGCAWNTSPMRGKVWRRRPNEIYFQDRDWRHACMRACVRVSDWCDDQTRRSEEREKANGAAQFRQLKSKWQTKNRMPTPGKNWSFEEVRSRMAVIECPEHGHHLLQVDAITDDGGTMQRICQHDAEWRLNTRQPKETRRRGWQTKAIVSRWWWKRALNCDKLPTEGEQRRRR